MAASARAVIAVEIVDEDVDAAVVVVEEPRATRRSGSR